MGWPQSGGASAHFIWYIISRPTVLQFFAHYVKARSFTSFPETRGKFDLVVNDISVVTQIIYLVTGT
jgi:hypothetical protein